MAARPGHPETIHGRWNNFSGGGANSNEDEYGKARELQLLLILLLKFQVLFLWKRKIPKTCDCVLALLEKHVFDGNGEIFLH